LKRNRFGFEPEITAKVAKARSRVFEVGISYNGRTYEEGKKIGWRDGVRAIYVIVKYNLFRRNKGSWKRQYSGVDVLEALESAHNYNDYLTRLIRESTESKDLIDFGAGIGTFSKRLRTAGYHVNASNRIPYRGKNSWKEGFDTLDNITSIPG
jgi:hypothetical protein